MKILTLSLLGIFISTSCMLAEDSYGTISAKKAKQLIDRGVTVIDVRTPDEFAEGRIPGAVLIDFYGKGFNSKLAELDKEKEYILYCRSGNRSGQAIARLKAMGYHKLYDMGPFAAWEREGYAVEK